MVRARVRAFSRFGFPCSNPDPVVEPVEGRARAEGEGVSCFFCVRKDVQLEGRSKMDERKESAEDLDYCLLLLVER